MPVMASLEIVDRVHPEGLPPAHVECRSDDLRRGRLPAGRSISRLASRRKPDRIRSSSERTLYVTSRRADSTSQRSEPSS